MLHDLSTSHDSSAPGGVGRTAGSEGQLVTRVLLLLWCLPLSIPLQERRQLPPLPSDFRLSAIAHEMAGHASGEVLATRTAADGRAYPIRLRVVGTPTGSVAHGELIAFQWEDEHPPVQLESPTGHTYQGDTLCVFDANRRLLVVSSEHEPRCSMLLSALGMARFPSRRFSAEELDWAWLASHRHGLPNPLSSFGLEGFVARAGHRELVLRFGSRDQRLEILGGLQGKAALTPDDVEHLELCQRDLGELQSLAVHTLLEHGRHVDPAPFLSEDNRLCARLALGDEGAQAEILARLERAERVLLWDPRARHSAGQFEERARIQRTERMPSLVELAAYGTSAALPYVRAFVRKHVENGVFAWLALGGSGQELLELHGGEPMQVGPWGLTRAGTMEALRLELARCRRASEMQPAWLTTEVAFLDVLSERLRAREPRAVLELVQPFLRACLARAEAPALRLRMSLLRAGDEQVIAELERMSADEIGQSPPPELAEAAGDKVVAILVKLLVRSLAGFDFDCTGQASQNVAYLARVLHGRRAAERALALRLFESSSLPARASADDLTCIRWALGELPEPLRLLQLERSPVAVACGLELASDAAHYARALLELRADPRKNWWPLALLGDEESVPAFGRWLAAGVARGERPWEPLFALEKTGSPAGAEWIYAAIPGLDPMFADACYTVLGEIESPERLARLASFCATRPRTQGEPAWQAFLILLGRRP